MHMLVGFHPYLFFTAWVTRTVEDQLTHQKRQKLSGSIWRLLCKVRSAEMYSEVGDWKPLTIFAKNSILDVRMGS